MGKFSDGAGGYGNALTDAVAKVAACFGYTTEYIAGHSLAWLEWAYEAALRHDAAGYGIPAPEIYRRPESAPAEDIGLGKPAR